MIEDRAAALYRALNRSPPRVLATDDPLTFFRCVRALGRPGTAQLVLAGLLVMLLFVGLMVGQPAPRQRPEWAIGLMVYTLAMLAWLEGIARAGVPIWLRLLPAGLLALVLALAGALVLGGLQGTLQGVTAGVFLYTFWRLGQLLLGDLGGRLALRRAGFAVPLLGSPAIGPSVTARLESTLADPQAERRPAGPQAAATADEQAAVGRLEALLERLPFWLDRFQLHPLLGRGLAAWRVRSVRSGRDLTEPPRLLAEALALDQDVLAASLFRDALVALVGVTPATGARQRDPVDDTVEELGLGGDWRLLLRLPGSWRYRVLALLLDHETSPVIRLEGIQRLGPERMAAALGRRPLASDEAGELYRIGPEPQPTLLVKVKDAAQPDDQPRHHWIPVPPHVASAREAVAWTFGTSERAYRPAVET